MYIRKFHLTLDQQTEEIIKFSYAIGHRTHNPFFQIILSRKKTHTPRCLYPIRAQRKKYLRNELLIIIIHTETNNRVFDSHRYTDDNSRQICLIYVNEASRFYQTKYVWY